MSEIKVSAVLSIHNRSKLFRRALDGYLWQSMPPEEWEIVLLDDMSTEDLSSTYKHLLGRVNLVHVRMDHTKHPIFESMNPGWQPGREKNWYHTPALSINLGSYLARGRTICLCHPEILHAPENFVLADRELERSKLFIFGRTYIGTAKLNSYLTGMSQEGISWTHRGWPTFHEQIQDPELVSAVLDETQLYWYTSFLPKAAVEAARGVDFTYLGGVAAEDDDFRQRVYGAGWEPVHRRTVMGVHQYHEDETERHRDRSSDRWKAGLEHNRAVYRDRQARGFPSLVNAGYDWAARESLVSIERFRIGFREPEFILPGRL